MEHQITLPNSYYVPGASSHILSPQHWSQTAKDNKPNPRGTWCATYDDEIVLWWNQRKYKQSCPIDPNETNVTTIMTAPGYNRYKAFAAEVHDSPDDDENPLSVSAFDSNVVSEDEQEGESDTNEQEEAMSYLPDSRDSPLITDFDLNGPKESQQEAPTIINDEEDQIPQDIQAEFLQWHHRLGHVSPKKIWMLAKLNILPSRLAHCNIPLCTSCLFGKATRCPW